MLESKILEIRDEGTFIPCFAVNMNPSNETQRYYLRRCGYPCDGAPNIMITRLDADGTPAWNDPYAWGGRTWPVAHHYIIDHWAELKDGDIIDVSFILKESSVIKVSERFDYA